MGCFGLKPDPRIDRPVNQVRPDVKAPAVRHCLDAIGNAGVAAADRLPDPKTQARTGVPFDPGKKPRRKIFKAIPKYLHSQP